MKLRTQPPAEVVTALEQRGGRFEDVTISVATDINRRGVYDPQWLLVSSEKLWVIDRAQPQPPVYELELADVSEVRMQAVVGSGLLQVRTGEMWVDLMRFSNRLRHPFGQVARRLKQLVQGRAVDESDLEDRDPTLEAELAVLRGSKGAALRRALGLLRPYRKLAAAMGGLLLLAIALDMALPMLTRFLVDRVIAEPGSGGRRALPGPLGELSTMHLLLVVVGAVAGVQVLQMVVTAANGRLASYVGTGITHDVRGRLVRHLSRMGLSFYDRRQSGSLVGRVAYDTEAVHGFMDQLTNGFLMQVLLVVFSLVMMFSLEPWLAVWTLVPAPVVLVGTMLFYRLIYPRYQRQWDRSARQAGLLNSLFSGVRVVKAFGQEEHELGRFGHASREVRGARRHVDMSAAAFFPFMGLLFQVGGWIVWYVGGQSVLGTRLSLGTLMAFFGYMGMFYGPLGRLANLTSWLTEFTTQIHRIFEVLDREVDVPEAEDPVRLERPRGEIEFRDVTFGYTPDHPVLKGVSFRIAPGESVGVVGRSGSGKSTLINLISRFYDPDEGQVLLDGVDLREVAGEDLRRAVGIVLQEPFLFRGTIRDNLCYGRHDAGPDEVITATRAGNAHDLVVRKPHGYDSWVGERGAGLSGGEKQRLSLARAILCDPRVLILDEATSAIDSESELAVQKAMNELVRGRTSLIIAHRLSTLRSCDRILVVDDGRIAESGSHEELMARGGQYARMVRIQQGEEHRRGALRPAGEERRDQQPAWEWASGVAGAEHGGGGVATMPAPSRVQAAAADDEPEFDPDTGLAPLDHHHPRWLTPEVARVHLGSLNTLHVTVRNEGIYHGVHAVRCFSVQWPDRYISLRYADSRNREHEIGIIRDLAEWPEEAQGLVEEALRRRYFIHTITRVHSIRQIQGYLELRVDTDLGPHRFIMRSNDEGAQDYGPGGKILLDVEENRYLIPSIGALPAADRRLFQRYIHW